MIISQVSYRTNGPLVMKERFGCLDTPHLIFKSHKTMCSDQRSLQQFLRISFSFFFFFSFLPQLAHEGQNSFQKNKSYARTHMGMRLTVRRLIQAQDCKPSASRVNVLAIQIKSVPFLGRYELCSEETVPCLCCSALAICKGWVEGYCAAYLYTVRGFDA